MKRLLFILCISFYSTTILAQEAKVKWGTLSKDEFQFKSIVPFGNGLIKLSLKKDGRGKTTAWIPVLTKYDQNLDEMTTVTLSEIGDRKYERLVKMKENLFAIVSEDGEQKNQTKFSAQLVDEKTLMPKGSLIEIGSFFGVDMDVMVSNLYTFSQDSSTIYFQGRLNAKDLDVDGFLFDKDMKRIWQNNTMRGSGAVLANNKYFIKFYIEETKTSTPGAMKIVVYNAAENKSSEIKVAPLDDFLMDYNLISQDGNRFTFFGKKTNKQKYGLPNGYYTAVLDLSAQTFKVQTGDFNDIHELLLLDEQASKKDKAIHIFFNYAGSAVRTDGSSDHFLEYQWKEMRVTGTTGNYGTDWNSANVYWNWYDIINIHIAADGKAKLVRIPKLGGSYWSQALSNGFKAVPYKNKILLFYLDSKKNIERDLSKSVGGLNFKDAVLIMATIDEKGNITRKVVDDSFSNDYKPSIPYSIQLTNNKIVLVGQSYQSVNPTAISKEVLGILEIE